jgi:phosphoribosylformimino-5-aminoimidazole carboxamide ribotide isomerase
VLYTDIARDGTGTGPNVEATVRLQMRVAAPVIASGGVASLDDVHALASAGVQACVIGRALLEGAFTVEEALEAAQPPC